MAHTSLLLITGIASMRWVCCHPQIMNAPVVGVSPIASVPRIVALLRMTGHNGFPVLAPPEDLGAADGGGGSGMVGADGRLQQPGHRKPRAPRRLLGMILRSQLQVLLERGALCDAEGALQVLTPVPTLHPPHSLPRSHP